jgi:hypothetical protein
MAEMVERATFVREYAERSGLVGQVVITDFGLLGDGWSRVAMPCDCGEAVCEGWQMANPSEYLSLLLPTDRRAALSDTPPASGRG